MSPYLPDYFISPDTLYNDLSRLAKYCHPKCISLLGGEPLLHPQLLEIINIVRKSGISERIRVVTNGLLLGKMPKQFWESVNEVHISVYPNHPMKMKNFAKYKALASNKTQILLKYQDNFNEFFFEDGHSSELLIKKIYLTCHAPRAEGCHTLYQGHYYKCPQAVFIPIAYNDRKNFNEFQDGIKIRDSSEFIKDLEQYLTSEAPLEACRYCLGSVGKRFKPSQISQSNTSHRSTIDELIDWRRLERLERRKKTTVASLLREAGPQVDNLLMGLPPSILLSPKFRKLVTTLKKIARFYK